MSVKHKRPRLSCQKNGRNVCAMSNFSTTNWIEYRVVHGKGNHLKQYEMDAEGDKVDRLIILWDGGGWGWGGCMWQDGCDRMRNISPWVGHKTLTKVEVEAASNMSAVMGYKMGSVSAISALDHCPHPRGGDREGVVAFSPTARNDPRQVQTPTWKLQS